MQSKRKPSPEALAKAWSPEARAKAVATRKRNAKAKKRAAEAEGAISLDMIPDPPKRKHSKPVKKSKPDFAARQEVVLALLKYLNDG